MGEWPGFLEVGAESSGLALVWGGFLAMEQPHLGTRDPHEGPT